MSAAPHLLHAAQRRADAARGRRDRIMDLIRAEVRRQGSTLFQVFSDSRDRRTVTARHAAICAVAEALPELSSKRLAEIFDRDHTTILYALGRTARARTRKAAPPIAAMPSRALPLDVLHEVTRPGSQQRLLLRAFIGAYPAAVTREVLEGVAWGGRIVADPGVHLRVALVALRRRIQRNGWSIVHRRGLGWALVDEREGTR